MALKTVYISDQFADIQLRLYQQKSALMNSVVQIDIEKQCRECIEINMVNAIRKGDGYVFRLLS